MLAAIQTDELEKCFQQLKTGFTTCNVSAHTALSFCQFFADNSMNPLSNAPYPSEFDPCDFFVPQLKKVVKEHRCNNAVDENKKKKQEFAAIQTDDFEQCF